jgi:hypothetical protein
MRKRAAALGQNSSCCRGDPRAYREEKLMLRRNVYLYACVEIVRDGDGLGSA